MLMSATNGIEMEIPWTSSIMRSHLLPHPGYCSLHPTAPVASILDSPTRAVGPAMLLVHIYAHACCHRERRQVQRMMSSSDDVGSCSASGANILACAYC